MDVLSTALRFLDELKRLFPWVLPLKLFLSALLIALGGAGFLGYLSEYATYCFAINYGFRAPVEGIPYLKATVAFGSFFLLLTGGVFFVFTALLVRTAFWSFESIILFLRWIARRFSGARSWWAHDFRRTFERMAARPFWQVFLASLLCAGLGGLIGYYEVTWLALFNQDGRVSAVSFAFFMSGYGFVAALSMVYRKAAWWLASAATTIYFLGCIFILFSPKYYAEFLRIVGFGGGAPVKLIVDEGSAGGLKTGNYFLMLRTNDAFLILNEDKSVIMEIPKDRVKAVTYRATKVINP